VSEGEAENAPAQLTPAADGPPPSVARAAPDAASVSSVHRAHAGRLRRWYDQHGHLLWTVGLLLPLVLPKIQHVEGMREYGTDGGHYVDVARHLAEGDGFTTSLSALHQGYTSFPHPSSIYPAWPMLMAALLQVFSLRFVTAVVPAILYFVVLLLADQVGRRLSPARWPRPLHMFDGGHALLMCFAAATKFFQFTSKPYSEGMSFAVALLFLLRAGPLLGNLGVRAGIELGLWLALLFYCRSHFVIFALGLFAAFALEGALRLRRRDAELAPMLSALGACALTAAALWLPMQIWLASFVEDPGLGAYFRFDRARATSHLTEILPAERTALSALLLDRLQGGLKAFDPRWRHSYFHSFGPLTYALPLAVAAVMASGAARARLVGMLRDADARLFRMAVAITALGGMASIHAVHKNFSYEWYFASRHATICAFAFFLAAIFALRSPRRVIAALAALLLLGGIGVGYARAYERAERTARIHPTTRPVIAWLADLPQHQRVVIAGEATVMRRALWQAPTELRRRVGVHTTYGRTTISDLRALATRLGVEYFIMSDGSRPARSMKTSKDFRLVDKIAVRANPRRLLVFKHVGPPASAPRIEPSPR
jgi:hypothetical protein